VTEQECQKLFQTYNLQFFSGRLPAYRIIRSNRYVKGANAMCRKKQREIHLGAELQGITLKKCLLHEMAHAATNVGHGKLWLTEMHRLAEMGAPTREELNDYKDPAKRVGTREIAAEVYDAGFETDLPWRDVRSRFGREYNLIDDRGRSESKGAANLLKRFRKEFWKGRRFRETLLIPGHPSQKQ
jgi:hypothetical protein